MLVRLKGEREIAGFAVAGRHAAAILELLATSVKVGITTREIDDLARSACADHGVVPVFLGYHGYPAAVCVSVNNELVHGIPGNRVLVSGDLVKIDIGVEYNGFIGDTAMTVRVGSSFGDDLDRMLFDCRTALLRGIAAAKPGGNLADIGTAISEVANECGWQPIIGYGGHGIDKGTLHADPFVDNAGLHQMRLRPGMVLAIEPMFVAGLNNETQVADDKWTVLANGPTAHFEHTIVVTELGEPRILTQREEE